MRQKLNLLILPYYFYIYIERRKWFTAKLWSSRGANNKEFTFKGWKISFGLPYSKKCVESRLDEVGADKMITSCYENNLSTPFFNYYRGKDKNLYNSEIL